MSSAIRDLGLGLPPFHVEKLGNANVSVWRGVCDCGYPTKKYPQLGLVLEQMTWHGEIHRVQRQERVA